MFKRLSKVVLQRLTHCKANFEVISSKLSLNANNCRLVMQKYIFYFHFSIMDLEIMLMEIDNSLALRKSMRVCFPCN